MRQVPQLGFGLRVVLRSVAHRRCVTRSLVGAWDDTDGLRRGIPACQFATVPDALAAAVDGDIDRAGTFAGAVDITKNVRLVGAGADQTAIRGGGGLQRSRRVSA